jgi:hypothetical protein
MILACREISVLLAEQRMMPRSRLAHIWLIGGVADDRIWLHRGANAPAASAKRAAENEQAETMALSGPVLGKGCRPENSSAISPLRRPSHRGEVGKSETAATTPPFMILKDFPEGSWKSLQDHGSTVGGAWRDKSETPSFGVIMGKWSPGQPFSHDHDAGGRGVGLDHGSSAPGTTGFP